MFNLLALLDDIAATLDDVAVISKVALDKSATMTKVAMKKTSAIMTDDLAVNAGVVTDVHANRELPIVKAIFLGSLINKIYCIVGVFLLLYIYPPILTAVLLLGGAYLSYEGAHKVFEKLSKKKKEIIEKIEKVSEKDKIKGAIRTDLILSIEIIVIANDAVASGTLGQKVLTLSIVGFLASVLIYGLVALLVKIDDFGLYLINKKYFKTGLALVRFMPYMMKALGIGGTIAMFLVGGGIFNHTFHLPLYTIELLQNFIVGIIVGIMTLGIVSGISRIKKASV